MKNEISILLCVALFLLLPLSYGFCLSATQIDGLCAACNPPLLLIAGYCIPPMPGCTSQLANNICGQCSASYTLSRSICVPVGTTITNPMSSTLELYANTSPDYGYEYLNIYFKQKYSQFLSTKISDVTQLVTVPTTYGSIYTITYYSPYSNTTMYRAEGSVDYFYNITEFSFGPVSSNNSNLLWYLNRKTQVSNLISLQPAILNKIQQLSSNDYRLFYLDFSGKIQVIDVQRTLNISSTFRTFTTLTQLYYQINQNTVINYVFSEFPYLQNYQNYTASYYTLVDSNNISTDYFKFIFDNQVVVVIAVCGLNFSLFSYQEPDSISTDPAATLNIPGGYLPLLTLTDPIYLSAYSFLVSNYPFLIYKNVEDVRYQLVAGTKYLITFNSQPFSTDIHVAVIFQPLGVGSQPVISSIYKNGIDITNTIMSTPPGGYNYQSDLNFKALYNYFRTSMNPILGNLLPIYQVLYVANANNTFSYQVIYSSAQSVLLQYSPATANPYIVVSYAAMGIAIPTASTVSSQSGSDVTRNSIVQFLKQENPQLLTTILIISQTSPAAKIYKLDLLTPFGIYFARVVNNVVLYISALSYSSPNLCSDLAVSEFTSNSVVAALNTYITTNYQIINGYSLQLVQGFMNNTSINYRFLYSSGVNRYQFQMVYSTSLGKYLTNKVTPYNGGICNPTAVLIGSQCIQSCLSFIF